MFDEEQVRQISGVSDVYRGKPDPIEPFSLRISLPTLKKWEIERKKQFAAERQSGRDEVLRDVRELADRLESILAQRSIRTVYDASLDTFVTALRAIEDKYKAGEDR